MTVPASVKATLDSMKEAENELAGLRLRFDDPKRASYLETNIHVVYSHDDGGKNQRVLTPNGEWSDNRFEACLCIDDREAEMLCRRHGFHFFGNLDPRRATVDCLKFRDQKHFEEWAAAMDTDDVEDEA